MPKDRPIKMWLDCMNKTEPSSIPEFNAAIDGWHLWLDQDEVGWLGNTYEESFKLPPLQEEDLVKVAFILLIAYCSGYITGQGAELAKGELKQALREWAPTEKPS